MINTNDTWEPQSNWDEHPIYTLAEWKMDVNAGDTRLGYHDYVQHCLEANNSDNQLVLSAAPRWAWITIDELLAEVSNDGYLDNDGDYLIEGEEGDLNQIQPLREAYRAILLACERADDEPISRRQIQTLMQWGTS